MIRLSIASHDARDIAAAKAQLGEALDTLPTGDALSRVTWLDACAGLSVEFASATDAARLWGCAQRSREELGSPMPMPERDRHERLVVAARRALRDDAAFELAWNEGRSWSLDEALRHALSQ